MCIFTIQFQVHVLLNWTMPLHYASKHGLSEVVQVLISHGATVDVKDEVSSTDNVYLHELISC